MITITDEAERVMAEYLAEAHSGVRLWDLYTHDTRTLLIENYLPTAAAALRSALPHLTDDGAAAPPADKGAANTPAAESATTTAAPSSPHLRTALEKLVQQWQYSDGKGFRGFYEAVESLLAAYPIGAATPFELEFELISWHRKEGYEAGLAARGATPAIDREALKYLLSYHYYDAKWSKEHQGFRCVCGWLGEDHVQHVVDLIAGAS